MAKRYSSALVLGFALVFVVSAWTGTFVDDFEDGDLEDWHQFMPNPGDMLWKVIDGELECSRMTEISTDLATGENFWTDYTIKCDVKLLQDYGPGDFALIVRVTSANNGYGFLLGDWVGKPSVYVQQWPNLNMKVTKPFDSLELDTWYHLKLEVEGSSFTFWINDEMILEYQDAKYSTGMVGFGVANYAIRCDNVVITGPDVPDVVPPTWEEPEEEPQNEPVETRGKLATTWGGIKRSDDTH